MSLTHVDCDGAAEAEDEDTAEADISRTKIATTLYIGSIITILL
jgi:hypothetical protein